MASKTGKTHGQQQHRHIWQYEQIHWQKSPCIYKACHTISTFGPDSCWLESDPVQR